MPEPTAHPGVETFRAAFDAAVPGICVEQDFLIRYANPALARIFGAPDAEALVGQDFRTLAAPEDRGRVEDQARGALHGGPGPERFDFRGRRRDGATIWLDATAALARWAEAPAIVRTVLDVTTSRQLQEQLVRTQKIEAVGRLAGGVAHDFNNLLTVILGRAEMLLQRPAGEGPDAADARRDVEMIYKTASQGTTLIQQLMAFARRDTLETQPVSLNDVLQQLAPMLRHLIPEHVEMRLALAPELGRVSADPSQLEQVVVNLVVNARDAMPAGGVVTIETGEIVLGAPEAAVRPGISPGTYVTLTVCDTGAGMDETTRQRVFEPFFTTKPMGKGTGLGLATVYAIVRQSSGWIDVESAPGQGSRFRLFLPRVVGDAAPARGARATATGTGTILVVEDDEGVRLMAADALRMFGHHVLDARDPDEALTLAAAHGDAIDLVVTDVVMPRMSGPALVEHLHLAHPRARVLYISGYGEDLDVLRGLLARGVPFLQKPFTVSALSSAVARMLEGDESFPS